MSALELRVCPACQAPSRSVAADCPRCGVELPGSGLAAAFPAGELYLRPAPGLLVALRELTWLLAVIVPWLALALALCVLKPAAWLDRQGVGPALGLLIDPRPFHSLAGWANCLAGFALVIALGWRWQRAELPRPARRERWRSALLLIGLAPAGVVVLAFSAGGAYLGAVPDWIQASAPASALTGTALGLALSLALAPLLLNLALCRWIGARYGAVEALGDQVAWRSADGRGLRVAAKRDLGARRVTPRGILVEAPGGGAFLLPARGEEAQREALAALDDFDPGAEDLVEAGRRARFLPWLTLLVVLVPTLFAALHLGLAWVPPALALSLLLQALPWGFAARWSDARLDAPRVHLGRAGLLAGRWIPWEAVRAASRAGELLTLEVDPRGPRSTEEGGAPPAGLRGLRPGRYTSSLAGWTPEQVERLSERLGGLPERPSPDGGRRRSLVAALALCSLALVVTLGLIARPPFSPRIWTSDRDYPGNRWVVVARLGELDALTIVSPEEDPELPEASAPGLPEAGLVVVAGDPPRVLAQRADAVPGLGRSLWWHMLVPKAGHFPASIFLGGEDPVVRGIREGRTAIAYGQFHTCSSVGVKQSLQYYVVRGEVRALWLTEGGGKLGPGTKVPSGDRRLEWHSTDGLRVSFPDELPTLAEVLRARDRSWEGLAAEETPGEVFPFWRHQPPEGCSRWALRAVAQIMYGAGRRWRWGSVPKPLRQQLSDLSQGVFPLQWSSLAKLTPEQRLLLEPHLLPFQRELVESPDERQQRAGLRSLGRRLSGLDAATWAAVSALTRSPEVRVRFGLVSLALHLGKLDPEPVCALLERLLADPDEGVRHEAAEALGAAGSWQRPQLRQRAVKRLEAFLARPGEDPELTSRVLVALSKVAAAEEAWAPFFDYSLRPNSPLQLTANTLIGDRLARTGGYRIALAAYERARARHDPPLRVRLRVEKVLRRYAR